MLPTILLCVLLLQALCTCSVVNTDGQPQDMLNEEALLENLKSAFSQISESVECSAPFQRRLVAVGQAAERFWKMCLDKMAAYSHNQGFFKNTLPDLMDNLDNYPEFNPPLEYNSDALLMDIKIFCELQFCRSYLNDLQQLANVFNAESSPFEGLSDEVLTLAADYMRSTINLQTLYLMVEDPEVFKDVHSQSMNDPIYQSELLYFLVNLRRLIKELKEVDLVNVYHRLSNALKATRDTMVPANEALVGLLTDFLYWGVPVLAEETSRSISVACDRFGFAHSASKILADIEAITVPLYRAGFELDRGVAEQRGRGDVLWDTFFESLFAFESILVKPRFDSIRQVSENFSELINHLFDTFLRGEDELWTLGLQAKLKRAGTLWGRALKILISASNINELMCWLKYCSSLLADRLLFLHMMNLVEKAEDPLAFDRPTREKLVELWKGAQILLKLFGSLSLLKKMAPYLVKMAKFMDAVLIKESLSGVFDEQINAVKRQGINFQTDYCLRFVNELPEHQEKIAQDLKSFFKSLSHIIAKSVLCGMIENSFLPLKSPIYTPLKQSLKQSLEQLFRSPPQLLQPPNFPSHSAESRNKRPKKLGSKSERNNKSRKVAVPKAPAPTNMQVFVHSGPQYVEGDRVLVSTEDDDLKLFEESFENAWTVVEAQRNRQTFGCLAKQPARQVLQRFANKPRGADAISPTDPRDMRSDKKKVKIATFNAEWLFLFDLATEKLNGKIKWKSLEEAWGHIKDVANVIRKIDADIICLCEVQDLRILSILVELLPELGYRAYLIPSHDSLSQNVGILTQVDTLASISKIEEAFFPKNIIFHLKLDNGCGELVDLVLTGVHLISSTTEAVHAERARRREVQAMALKQRLASEYGTSEGVIHLVLGDFNMVDPELLSAQPAHLPERALEIAKHAEFDLFNAMDPTHAPGDLLSSSVCHIFTSHPHLIAGSQIIRLEDRVAPYQAERVSDHAPVVTTIHLPNHAQGATDQQ